MGPLDRGGLIQNKSFYSQPVFLVAVLRVSYSLSLICLKTSEDIKHKILSLSLQWRNLFWQCAEEDAGKRFSERLVVVDFVWLVGWLLLLLLLLFLGVGIGEGVVAGFFYSRVLLTVTNGSLLVLVF